MARRDALLRLHQTLQSRLTDLRKKLSDDLHDLRNAKNAATSGDVADAAFESGSDEMASQLAELDSREITQIESAVARLKQGTYGLRAENCQEKIPVGRLNALPYTTLCIACQRELERYPRGCGVSVGNWENVFDASRYDDHKEVDLSKLEIDLPSH